MKIRVEFIIVNLLIVFTAILYNNQERIKINDGKGWDGSSYYAITEKIMDDVEPLSGEYPFIYRVGFPCLVACVTNYTNLNILDSAYYINLTGVIILTNLLYAWLLYFIKNYKIRLVIILMFLFTWHAPLRIIKFYPMLTDIWGSVWLLLCFHLIYKIKHYSTNKRRLYAFVIIFSIIVAIGTLFRESNLAIALGLLFIFNPLSYNKSVFDSPKSMLNYIQKMIHKYKTLMPVFFIFPFIFALIIKYIVTKNFITEHTIGYAYFDSLIRWIYTRSLPEFLTATCISYGVFGLLIPYFIWKHRSILWERQEIAFLLFVFTVLGYVGGTDTERILYMSTFPIVFVFIGLGIEKMYNSEQRWWLWILLLINTLPARVFWYIPNTPSVTNNTPYPIFTLLGTDFQYLYLYSHHGNWLLNLLLLIEFLILAFLSIFIIHYKVSLKDIKQFIIQ